ncbi:MAG: TonB-dependent receptor [Bryobacteraceae bacterium]
MVPGLDVAQINTNSWAVSARGFNDKYANKLLVLVDGRSVYSELYSGTEWDVQNPMLEDIDRIEVIRGPGATVWGANAVNGVINIITKSSKDTQGALAVAGAGATERGFGEFRYGGQLGSSGYYRAYAKTFDRSPLGGAGGGSTEGDWSGVRGGFRMDWNASPRDVLMVEGDSYSSGLHRTIDSLTLMAPFDGTRAGRAQSDGATLLTRWRRRLANGSETVLQISYEHSGRQELFAAPALDIVDADFQDTMPVGKRNSIVWGVGYRFTGLQVAGHGGMPFPTQSRQDNLFDAFVQDEIGLAPETLTLTVGSKFEHNPFSGFEVQPSARLAWTPGARQTLWAAVSRAVRTPSVTDTGIDLIAAVVPGPGGLPAVVTAHGNPDFHSEDLEANELGYRLQPSSRVSVDVAAFFNSYTNLRSVELDAPYFIATPAPGYLVVSSEFGNQVSARTYGVELSANVKLAGWWRLSPGYTWLKMVPSTSAGSQDITTVTGLAHGSPQHQFQIRSYLDLPWRLEFDASVYSVGGLPAQSIPGYVRSDARLGWRATPRVELSIAGENLLNGAHLEFFIPEELDALPLESRRSVYGKVTWQF